MGGDFTALYNLVIVKILNASRESGSNPTPALPRNKGCVSILRF